MGSPLGKAEHGELQRGIVLVLFSALAYGAMPILTKLVYARGIGPVNLLAYRFAIALVVMAVLAPRGEAPPWRERFVLWGLGLVFVANAATYFHALTTAPAALVSLLLYTYPVIVTFLAAAAGLEALRARSVLAAALVVAGCALTVRVGSLEQVPSGAWFALLAAFVYASYIVLGARFAPAAAPETAARHVVQVCAAAFALWGASTGELTPSSDIRVWGLLLAIALFSTVFPLRTFLAGLAATGPGRAAVLSSFEIIVTLVLAALILGEPVAARQWAGGALILAGVLVQNTAALRALRQSRATAPVAERV